MIKDATTWKAGLPAPATFWASFLVSSAVVNCLPLQAAPYPMGNEIAPVHANEVPDTVATSSVPQKAASVEAAAKTLTVGDVASVAELTSAQKDSHINKVQEQVTISPPLTLQGVQSQSLGPDEVHRSFSEEEQRRSAEHSLPVSSASPALSLPTAYDHTSLQAAPAQVSAEAPTIGNVPAVAELTSNKGDSDTNKVTNTVATPPPPHSRQLRLKYQQQFPLLAMFPLWMTSFQLKKTSIAMIPCHKLPM